jgi:hypothetical protein
MASAKSILERMIAAMNRGETARKRDVDVSLNELYGPPQLVASFIRCPSPTIGSPLASPGGAGLPSTGRSVPSHGTPALIPRYAHFGWTFAGPRALRPSTRGATAPAARANGQIGRCQRIEQKVLIRSHGANSLRLPKTSTGNSPDGCCATLWLSSNNGGRPSVS